MSTIHLSKALYFADYLRFSWRSAVAVRRNRADGYLLFNPLKNKFITTFFVIFPIVR